MDEWNTLELNLFFLKDSFPYFKLWNNTIAKYQSWNTIIKPRE